MSLIGNPVVFREDTPAGTVEHAALVQFEYRPAGSGLVDLVVFDRPSNGPGVAAVRIVDQVLYDDPNAPHGGDRGWRFPGPPEASGLV